MKINVLILLILGHITNSAAEKFSKIEGTTGEVSDIVIDSKGRWYIIKNKILCSSVDKGVTCDKIDLPSNELVHTGIGLDQFDNIYVQDHKFNVFIVAPSLNRKLVMENITLTYENERLVSRPFAIHENIVYFATKSGVMKLDNSLTIPDRIELPPISKTETTQLVRSNSSERFSDEYEELFYSAGGPRHWVYVKSGHLIRSVIQTISSMKRMNAVGDLVFCIINGKKEVEVIHHRQTYDMRRVNRDPSYVNPIKGVDVSNINADNDFVIFSPKNDYKTYIYGNVDNTGTLYELGERKVDGKYITEVVSTHKLDNVRLLSGAIHNDRLYFGTSDGIYELTDIQPKRVFK